MICGKILDFLFTVRFKAFKTSPFLGEYQPLQPTAAAAAPTALHFTPRLNFPKMDANENLAATNSEEAAILSIEPSDEFGASTDKPSRKRLNHLDPAVNPLGLSKNQLRKKMRREERREALMAKRIAERKRKKISTREKWIKAKAEAPDVKFLSKKETIRQRKAKLTAAKDSGQKVAIDMSFCDIMSPKEIKQLARQVNLLYSSTGRAEQLWSLNIVGLQP